MLVPMPDGRIVDNCSLEYLALPFEGTPPDPLAAIAHLANFTPDWFVVGGVGDGNELACAVARWPNVRLLGIDPDPRVPNVQKERGTAAGARFVSAALMDVGGSTGMMARHGVGCCSLHSHKVSRASADLLHEVPTTTLDAMHAQYGFTNAVLWLDCEGCDRKALEGASHLLASSVVKLIVFEVWYAVEEDYRAVQKLLTAAGYAHRLTFFKQWWGHNEAWVLT